MRMARAGCLAALSVGLLASLVTAQSSPGRTTSATDTGRFGGLFGTASKPQAKKDKGKEGAERPLTAPDRALEQERLMKAYLRRLAVCDRLRDIALETNDAALSEEAGRLDEMAWTLYHEQSNRLLGVQSMAMEPEAVAEGAALPDPGKALRKASGGSALPPRVWSGGRIEPARGDSSKNSGGEELR